jgi:hypothetical protein
MSISKALAETLESLRNPQKPYVYYTPPGDGSYHLSKDFASGEIIDEEPCLIDFKQAQIQAYPYLKNYYDPPSE